MSQHMHHTLPSVVMVTSVYHPPEFRRTFGDASLIQLESNM